MTLTVSWILPLVLLPGMALLISSTSMRYGIIHDELHHILASQEVVSNSFKQHLRLRATLFRNALVLLYVGVTTFGLGSVIGAIVDAIHGSADWPVIVLTCFGILCLTGAAVELIRESVLSLQVIEHHLRMVDSNDDDQENKTNVSE